MSKDSVKLFQRRVEVGKETASQSAPKTHNDPSEDDVEKHMKNVLPEDEHIEDDTPELGGANLSKMGQVQEDESIPDEEEDDVDENESHADELEEEDDIEENKSHADDDEDDIEENGSHADELLEEDGFKDKGLHTNDEDDDIEENGSHADDIMEDLHFGVPSIGADKGRLPMLQGSYDWVRLANSHEERKLRRDGAIDTLAACKYGGYSFVDLVHHASDAEGTYAHSDAQAGSLVPLRRIHQMLSSTRIVRAQDVTESTGRHAGVCVRHGSHENPIDAAITYARAGQQVCVVNPASAYHVGGGFQTGGRHALEEALNMQSTLFQSLTVAQKLAEQMGVSAPRYVKPQYTRSGDPWTCHIPEDGAVLSPHVEVFRQDGSDGYPFMHIPVELAAVVSIAMPNFNVKVHDAPCDHPDTEREYEGLIEKKFTALLGAAALAGVEVLVMPSVGCGVYENQAEKVGHIFGHVLRRRFNGVFKEVHFFGSDRFTAAAEVAALGK